jgi:ABC-type amino acid transport substrate-binding protein
MQRALAALVLALLPSLASADLAEIKARGTLRVLYVPSNAPDEFFDMKSPDRPGFDRELLEGFAQLQRVKLETVSVAGWDELAPALVKGRGDLVAGRYSITESRKQLVNFSAEVFPTRHVVLTRKPTRVVTTLDELLRERIGTVRGSSMAEALAAAHVPAARIDDSLRPGLQAAALVDGRVSAVVMGVENAISEQRRDAAMQLGMFLGPPGSLAYALRKQDPELQRALDTYIESAHRSTAWSRLVVKYFGEAAIEVLKKARAQ